MRVLLTAFSCSPRLGSEPGAGWAWVSAAAERHDCVLLTSDEHVADTAAALSARPDLRLRIVTIPTPPWLVRGGPRLVRLRSLRWQVEARRLALRLQAEQPFDITHHVTLSADWQPAGLAGVAGPAFVWGPVGGGTPTPVSLLRWLGTRGLALELARRALSGLGRRLWGDRAASRASTALCQNAEVAARFARRTHAVVHPNVALSPQWLAAPAEPLAVQLPAGKVAVFVGRLLTWKGLTLALAALDLQPASDWSLVLVGEGPDRARLEATVARHRLDARVRFLGEQPRDQVMAILDRADALLFPSLHEAAGWVVAEATARGCPVVALDHGGPAALVAAGEGTLVSPGLRTARRLADALAATGTRIRPVTRWSSERLPDLIESIYEGAAARHAESRR